MVLLELIPFAALGLAFGSFLTVLVYRLPRKESIVAPRSRCPSCGNQIGARDNVPVMSWLVLRGRCRHCDAHISAEYPLVEALTGALFVGAAVIHRDVAVAGVLAAFMAVMVAAAMIDARHRIIPNSLNVPSLMLFGAAVLAMWAFGGRVDPLRALLGMLAYGGGLLLVAIISPKGMGMGDVKLGAVIGLVLGALGWEYVEIAMLAAVLAGGVGAVAVLAMGGSRKATMPFGPYLAAGGVLSALAGAPLAAWYAGLVR